MPGAAPLKGRLHAEYRVEQQASEMRDRADAGMRHVQLIGVRSHISCEFLEVVRRKVLSRHQQHRKTGDHADRREIELRIVGEAGIERDGRRVRSHVAQLNGVSIGVCAHRTRRAGGAARPDDVLDDELLPERARHVLAQDAGNDVGRPAGRERHDDRDRPRRIGLRRCRPRVVYCEGNGRDRQNSRTFRHHGFPPLQAPRRSSA